MSEILEGLRKSLVVHKKVKERNKESEVRWRKRELRKERKTGWKHSEVLMQGNILGSKTVPQSEITFSKEDDTEEQCDHGGEEVKTVSDGVHSGKIYLEYKCQLNEAQLVDQLSSI